MKRIVFGICAAVLVGLAALLVMLNVNRAPLSADELLADLDYMAEVLENNFALLEVAAWAHGADFDEMMAAMRDTVGASDMDRDAFLGALQYHFAPLRGTGHFSIFDFATYNEMSRRRNRQGIERMNIELMLSDEGRRFYGDVTWPRRLRYYWSYAELVLRHGRPFNRFDAADGFSQPFRVEIIEEGRIAYISGGVDMADLENNGAAAHRFLQSVADYQHLIIDMRGNNGGNVNHFINFFAAPCFA